PAIEVRLNTIATAERLADDGADAIVVATGGTPIAPELPGGAATNIPIYQAHDVLDGRAGPIGNDVVIVGGGSTACETALFLKEQGSLDGETVKFLLIHRVMDPEELRQAALIGQPRRKITVVQRSARLAKDLNRSVRWTLLTALETAGVTLLANSQVRAVGAAEVTIEMQGGNLRSLPCDTIVLSTGIVSRSELAPQLRARLPAVPLFVIGDAASPRQATEAVEEGVRIGMQI
ncbi:MAG: FAD-dependent oxidoreductase, partial [Alphaproteobacteria bacterium]